MPRWPSPQEYFEAIQDPDCINDPELRSGELQLTGAHQLPLVFSGQFAIVFKIKSGSKVWAVRCFLHNFPDRTERYKRISEFILNDGLEHTVNFELIENGIKVADEFYPILKMEFVSGSSLGEYIREHCNKIEKLQQFQERFLEMMLQLKANGIAHGDLQHDNIVITNDGKIRLIDYDGMFVPSLEGHKANELGHLNYQHPKRNADQFNSRLDNFSAWLIKETIDLLIKENDRISLAPHGDCLLLNRGDFEHPQKSRSFFELERLSAHGKYFSRRIQYLLLMEPHLIPFVTDELSVPNSFMEAVTYTGMRPDWLEGFDPTFIEKDKEPLSLSTTRKKGKLPHLARALDGAREQSDIIESFGCRELFRVSSANGEHKNKDKIGQLVVDQFSPGEYVAWTGGLAPWLLSTKHQDLEVDHSPVTGGQIALVILFAFLVFQLFTNSQNWILLLGIILCIIFYSLHKYKFDNSIRHAHYTFTNSNLYMCFDGPRQMSDAEEHYHWTVHLTSIPLSSIAHADFPISPGMEERVRLHLINFSQSRRETGKTIWLHGLTEVDRKRLYKALGKLGIQRRDVYD